MEIWTTAEGRNNKNWKLTKQASPGTRKLRELADSREFAGCRGFIGEYGFDDESCCACGEAAD